MKWYRGVILSLALALALGASVSQGAWKMRVHGAGPVDEYFVSEVDSLTLYDDAPCRVRIPAGNFFMGSSPIEYGHDPDEAPAHGVTLTRAFYVCYREVIQTDWQAVMGWNDSSHQGALLPVEQVTWFDCISYCNKRSAAEGFDSVYVMTGRSYSGHHIIGATSVSCDWNKGGYRLLTEAEWEYACRAGTGGAYWNGEMFDQCQCCNLESHIVQIGWYCWNSGGQTHATMGLLGNPWGLHEMNGNVWEWCWDWYGPYTGGATDPVGPASGTTRISRGGGFDSWARHCRSAKRGSVPPGNRHGNLGLRVGRTAL